MTTRRMEYPYVNFRFLRALGVASVTAKGKVPEGWEAGDEVEFVETRDGVLTGEVYKRTLAGVSQGIGRWTMTFAPEVRQ